MLQWRVVDGIAQCSLKTLFRRTRQTPSDKSATASNACRYSQCLNKIMISISIKHDTDLHLDKVLTVDLIAFHRQDSLPKTDNKVCPRFAFLKISKIRFAAHLLVAAFGGWASPTTSKRAAIIPTLIFINLITIINETIFSW